LILARGGAKSMYAETIQAYGLNVDTSTTHQITTAPTMKQAEEVMTPFRTAITRARGPLFKFLTEGSMQNTTGNRFLRQKLAATKKGIENFLTGSLLEIRPMSINKLQGLRPKYSTVDEWLSGDIREDVVGAIEQGASKLDDYLIVAISSEGTVRNGSGDTIKLELARYSKGRLHRATRFNLHYRLDNLEEVADPAMWLKLNQIWARRFLMKPISWMSNEQRRRRPLGTIFLAKRFGIPMEGYTYFFTYEETLPHRPQNFWGMAVQWVRTFPRVTTSVPSLSSSQCGTESLASRLGAILRR
jgi:phage terminase large subunit-like protein